MISVIIPLYNAESTIVKALDSVKNQITDEVFEVFVINDGSTDNSKAVSYTHLDVYKRQILNPFRKSKYLLSQKKEIHSSRGAIW